MLEQGKNEMNIIDLSKYTRTETEVKPVIFQSTLGLEEKPFTGRYPSLSSELKEMVLFNFTSEKREEEESNYNFSDEPPTFEELFPKGKNKLSEDMKKILVAALEIEFDIDTQAAMIEVASTYFLNMVLFDYGIMPDRPNFIYCYLHNVKYIAEEDYERFENKEVLKTLEMLIELNYYYLATRYEFIKGRNNYYRVREFSEEKYITTACALVEKIVALTYKK